MVIVQSTLSGDPAFVCVVCGVPIEQSRYRPRIYCSEKCKSRSNRERHKERIKARNKSYRERLREETILIIGKGKVECVPCGCPHIGMLTIGHYRSNGKEHRDLVGRGLALYRWIIAASSSEIQKWGLQLECWNCNQYHAQHGEYPPKEILPKWS